jgi:hypothetical protein
LKLGRQDRLAEQVQRLAIERGFSHLPVKVGTQKNTTEPVLGTQFARCFDTATSGSQPNVHKHQVGAVAYGKRNRLAGRSADCADSMPEIQDEDAKVHRNEHFVFNYQHLHDSGPGSGIDTSME